MSCTIRSEKTIEDGLDSATWPVSTVLKCALFRTVSDVAREMARKAGGISVATVEDLDIVTTVAAVNLVVLAVRVAAQPVAAAFEIHLREMDVDGLTFRCADADAAVEVVPTVCESRGATDIGVRQVNSTQLWD